MKRLLICLIISVLFLLSASARPTKVISLDGPDWMLSFWPQPQMAVTDPAQIKRQKPETIKAVVPGNVELDLLAAGRIEDPMKGNNVNLLRQWEGYQWCYSKSFEAPHLEDGQRLELWFGGIDCLGEIWLNGIHIGSADNQLIEHTFDITPYLKKKNHLQVILRSSLLSGEDHLLGSISIGNFPAEESVYLRKAPHMFGWDIMPRLVSAGLWRSVELHVLNPARFRDVNYQTAWVDGHSANLYVNIQLKMPARMYSHALAKIVLSRKGKTVFEGEYRLYTAASRQAVRLDGVDLWWPRGYGEAALYDAHIELVDETAGQVVDTDDQRIGIRTVRLERNELNLPPEQPGKFRFYVNGVPIFVRGTNWVPADALHSRDKVWYKPVIEMAADLNCNMLRCWGGNVYEDHEFYDLCDENGLMVWQDFTMGCNIYPQTSEFCNMVEKEAVQVVTKLRNHPCIVLWAGNNEDDSCTSWGLGCFRIDPNKDRVSRETLARVVYEFDPTRPYLPSSPYFSEEVYKRGNEERMLPEAHLWGPRGYYKSDYYRLATNPFVSEIGYHGCPNLESLNKMMTPQCVYPWTEGFKWNEEWLTKCTRRYPESGYDKRNDLMLNQIRCLFGDVPQKLEDFIFASQSVQAEAMKYFVEKWRSHKFEPFSGIIWWNLRDGWPIISDAVTDYWCSKKLAYYYIRNVQKDVCCMIWGDKGRYELTAVNDTPSEGKGRVKVTDIVSGRVIYEGTFSVPANSRCVISELSMPAGQGLCLIEYQIGEQTFQNHYLYGEPPFPLNDYRKWIKDLAPSL